MTSPELTDLDYVRIVIARIDERTERTEDDVKKITHVLLEGNGTPAVTTQLATLNLKVSSLEKVTPDVAVKLATLALEVASLKEAARENSIPRHIWLAIVVSSLIGVAGLIIAFIK